MMRAHRGLLLAAAALSIAVALPGIAAEANDGGPKPRRPGQERVEKKKAKVAEKPAPRRGAAIRAQSGARECPCLRRSRLLHGRLRERLLERRAPRMDRREPSPRPPAPREAIRRRVEERRRAFEESPPPGAREKTPRPPARPRRDPRPITL